MKVSPGALVLSAALGAAIGQAAPAPEPTETVPATHPCTAGSPVVSYGYTISYARATPTAEAQVRAGYEPDPSWSSEHLLGTQVRAAPPPPPPKKKTS